MPEEDPRSERASGPQPQRYVIAEVEPLDVDGVRTLSVGVLVWLIALVALLPFSGELAEQGRSWWLWTCVAGFGLGLAGLVYCRRRRDRARSQPPQPADSNP